MRVENGKKESVVFYGRENHKIKILYYLCLVAILETRTIKNDISKKCIMYKKISLIKFKEIYFTISDSKDFAPSPILNNSIF